MSRRARQGPVRLRPGTSTRRRGPFSPHAIHARSHGVLARLGEALPAGVSCSLVALNEVPWPDLGFVAFAVGRSPQATPARLFDDDTETALGLEPFPLDAELAAQGVVVWTDQPLAATVREDAAVALLAIMDTAHRTQEEAQGLEAFAVGLAMAAQRHLGFSRQCSQLAHLDDRSWKLARILRRHGSELHCLLPDALGRADTLDRDRAELDEVAAFLAETELMLELDQPGGLGTLLQPAIVEQQRDQRDNARVELESARRYLEESERVLSTLCSEADQRSNDSLNAVVYWLGIITLGLGLVTLWDKYQTDQVFGLPVQSAAGVVAALATPLILLFALAAYRYGILLPGLRRTIGRTTEPLRRLLAWMGEWLFIGSMLVTRPRVSPAWFHFIEHERTRLIHALLAAREELTIHGDPEETREDLEDEIEEMLHAQWSSITMRQLAAEVRRDKVRRHGPTRIVDRLVADALTHTAVDATWYTLPRPLPPMLWATMLVQTQARAFGWAWDWSEVEWGQDAESRALILQTVLEAVRQVWRGANDGDCALDDADLWELLTTGESEGLPPPPGDDDWFDLLHRGLDTVDDLETWMTALRPLRSLPLPG